jgi:hypothetical protein
MQQTRSEVKQEEFRRSLMECVDSALHSFGYGVDNIVSFYLQNKDAKKGDLQSSPKVDEFDKGLNSFFGTVAAKIVEDAIIQQIKSKFGLSAEVTTVEEAIKKASEKSEIINV